MLVQLTNDTFLKEEGFDVTETWEVTNLSEDEIVLVVNGAKIYGRVEDTWYVTRKGVGRTVNVLIALPDELAELEISSIHGDVKI